LYAPGAPPPIYEGLRYPPLLPSCGDAYVPHSCPSPPATELTPAKSRLPQIQDSQALVLEPFRPVRTERPAGFSRCALGSRPLPIRPPLPCFPVIPSFWFLGLGRSKKKEECTSLPLLEAAFLLLFHFTSIRYRFRRSY